MCIPHGSTEAIQHITKDTHDAPSMAARWADARAKLLETIAMDGDRPVHINTLAGGTTSRTAWLHDAYAPEWSLMRETAGLRDAEDRANARKMAGFVEAMFHHVRKMPTL